MQRVTMGGALVLAMLMGCETADMTNTSKEVSSDPAVGAEALGELHVEVTYRERMLLPPTASLIVTLEDGARMDVAAEKIAEATLPTNQAPPYRVTLRYDSSKLQDRGRYGVRARI